MSSVSSLISKRRQWVTLYFTGGFGKRGIPPDQNSVYKCRSIS